MDNEKAKMLRGELYHSFSPALVAERAHCSRACDTYNTSASHATRLDRINLWNDITGAPHLPASTPSTSLDAHPWVEPPFRADYGTNITLGTNVFINFGCTILDTCRVSIGSRTLLGPSISLYAATHPLDPEVRNGTSGPECGAEIVIGDDCWLGGNVTVLQGVTIGSGAVVGAGSVVTKDVPEYSVVAGNPARVVRMLRPVEARVGRQETEGVKALIQRMERLENELKEVKGKLQLITESA